MWPRCRWMMDSVTGDGDDAPALCRSQPAAPARRPSCPRPLARLHPAPQRRGFHVYVVPLARRDWFNVGRGAVHPGLLVQLLHHPPGYSWCAQPVAQAAEQLRTSQARPLASPSTPQPRLLPPWPAATVQVLGARAGAGGAGAAGDGADQVGAWRPCVPACASAACAGCSLAAERSCMAWGHRDMGLTCACMRSPAWPAGGSAGPFGGRLAGPRLPGPAAVQGRPRRRRPAVCRHPGQRRPGAAPCCAQPGHARHAAHAAAAGQGVGRGGAGRGLGWRGLCARRRAPSPSPAYAPRRSPRSHPCSQVKDMTGGALTWVNSMWPGAAFASQGVRYAAVAGRSVRGDRAADRRTLKCVDCEMLIVGWGGEASGHCPLTGCRVTCAGWLAALQRTVRGPPALHSLLASRPRSGYACGSYEQVCGEGDGTVGDAVGAAEQCPTAGRRPCCVGWRVPQVGAAVQQPWGTGPCGPWARHRPGAPPLAEHCMHARCQFPPPRSPRAA